MGDLLSLFINSVFIGNILLAYFLGMCSFIAVSKNIETALGLGLAGMAWIAQSGAAVAYWWLGARYHEAAFLTPLLHALSRLLGWTVGGSQGSLFLPQTGSSSAPPPPPRPPARGHPHAPSPRRLSLDGPDAVRPRTPLHATVREAPYEHRSARRTWGSVLP